MSGWSPPTALSLGLLAAIPQPVLYDPLMDAFVEKMQRSPQNIRFDELDRFLRRRGFRARQRGGSHVVYKREDGIRLTVARPHGGRNTMNRAAVEDVLRKLTAEDRADGT